MKLFFQPLNVFHAPAFFANQVFRSFSIIWKFVSFSFPVSSRLWICIQTLNKTDIIVEIECLWLYSNQSTLYLFSLLVIFFWSSNLYRILLFSIPFLSHSILSYFQRLPLLVHTWYLSFFLHSQIFGEWNLHQKTPIFCVKSVKTSIFRVKSVKKICKKNNFLR